jgi:hypothetical protein
LEEEGNDLYGCLKQVELLPLVVSLKEVSDFDFTVDVPPQIGAQVRDIFLLQPLYISVLRPLDNSRFSCQSVAGRTLKTDTSPSSPTQLFALRSSLVPSDLSKTMDSMECMMPSLVIEIVAV